jgi:hypothetical protein
MLVQKRPISPGRLSASCSGCILTRGKEHVEEEGDMREGKRHRYKLLAIVASALATLVLCAPGAAASTSVKASFKCDQGINNATAQVWLLSALPTMYDDLATYTVGYGTLECGRLQSSFHAKTEITPSAPFSYVHVEFGAAACGETGCRYLCILGFPGLGFFDSLPIEASCTVMNGDKHPPSVTLNVE